MSTVAIVVDRAFGERRTELAAGCPVWIVDSPANIASIRDVWRCMTPEDAAGVTSFKDSLDASPEELCANIVGVVEEHHGEYSSRRWSVIEVFGAALTPTLRAAFEELGASRFESTADGFTCRRDNA